MSTWPKERPLYGDLTGDPVLWRRDVDWLLPEIIDGDFDVVFGTAPDAAANRLATFGHLSGPKGAAGVPHYLATRGTTPMHHDPAYPRWSVQLALYNVGLGLTGLDGKVWELPLGTLYCLDTHSPHQVVRIGAPTVGRRQKMQAAIDFTTYPGEDDDYEELGAYVAAHHPGVLASRK
jgi:hypothetical protein